MDFDSKNDFSELKYNTVKMGKGYLGLSLSGGGMDFSIKSGFRESDAPAENEPEMDKVVESFEKDVTGIIDAYTALIESRLRKLDAELKKLTDGQE